MPGSYFLRMGVQSDFLRHMAVFVADVLQELSTFQLMRIICCLFVVAFTVTCMNRASHCSCPSSLTLVTCISIEETHHGFYAETAIPLRKPEILMRT